MNKREIYTLAWYGTCRELRDWEERLRNSTDKAYKELCKKYIKEYMAKKLNLWNLLKKLRRNKRANICQSIILYFF